MDILTWNQWTLIFLKDSQNIHPWSITWFTWKIGSKRRQKETSSYSNPSGVFEIRAARVDQLLLIGDSHPTFNDRNPGKWVITIPYFWRNQWESKRTCDFSGWKFHEPNLFSQMVGKPWWCWISSHLPYIWLIFMVTCRQIHQSLSSHGCYGHGKIHNPITFNKSIMSFNKQNGPLS